MAAEAATLGIPISGAGSISGWTGRKRKSLIGSTTTMTTTAAKEESIAVIVAKAQVITAVQQTGSKKTFATASLMMTG